ncbi:M13 family metallopeptidase [candidate division KSB1 bacterium]|nr:M13 family metallopeptidase [candidate division KSB1 bacterium]
MLWGCSKTAKQTMPPLDPQNMDLTTNPGDNFYQYANGNWIKNNPIPDEYSRFGAFEFLIEENYAALQTILEGSAKNKKAQTGSLEQKIGDFYATAMDTVAIEKAGLEPLKEEFAKIAAIKTREDILNQIANMHSKALFPLFQIFPEQDQKNTEMVIVYLWQGGLGLTDRDYYLSDDGRSKELRTEYVKHIVKMFQLMGDDSVSAQKSADTILKFETRLAKASNTRLENRDPQKTFNKMEVQKLESVSDYNWPSYFKQIGVSDPNEVNVAQPVFFTEIGRMVNDVPVDDWKTYLRWDLINETADYLNSDFVNQNFNFYGTVLSGQKALQSRWKRMLRATNGALGEAVGQIYVEKYFPPAAKKRMVELVMNLKYALGERIKKLDWMSDETKQKALAKLEKMSVKIGYPDKWRDYTNLEINRDSFVENVLRANEFNFKFELDKVGKPVDRTEWHMFPQTVNAYYHPLMNEIVFPAAILQPPFFNMAADDAVNYGSIGVVIGHEMTHGFDDQGRQFDLNGELNDWWTAEDNERFKARSQKLVDQFDAYSVFDTLHVDGKLTLGENIADLGGLNIALAAYNKSLENKPQPSPIDDFTNYQRFFLGYAQLWRQNIRDKELMRRIKEDVHSPGPFRVNGPLVNMPEFYAAFDIKPDNQMFLEPDKRARIW